MDWYGEVWYGMVWYGMVSNIDIGSCRDMRTACKSSACQLVTVKILAFEAGSNVGFSSTSVDSKPCLAAAIRFIDVFPEAAAFNVVLRTDERRDEMLNTSVKRYVQKAMRRCSNLLGGRWSPSGFPRYFFLSSEDT